MVPVKTVDLKSVFFTLNGVRITGFGEGAAISLSPVSAIAEHMVTADGQPIVSRNNDSRGVLTVTLSETSLGYKLLAQQLKAQQVEESFGRRPIQVRDAKTGEIVSDQHAVFLTYPEISKGRGSTDRVFQILIPNAYGTDTEYGSDITI